MPLLLDKLQVEGTRLATVRALGVMAKASAPTFLGKVSQVCDALLTLLRKSDRTLLLETLHTCSAMLGRYPMEGRGDSQRLDSLLAQTIDFITDSDLMLAAAALSAAVNALEVCIFGCKWSCKRHF